jgi:hypothetical protein
MRRIPLVPATWLIGFLVTGAVDCAAQQSREPGFAVTVESGVQLQSVIYDEFVRVRYDTAMLTTQWTERSRAVPLLRASGRWRPYGSFHGYVAVQRQSGPTQAVYRGGLTAPDTFARRLQVTMLEGGIGIRLTHWANGRGAFEYAVGPVLALHRLDLEGGHRGAFLRLNPAAEPPPQPNWGVRRWSAWGIGLGAAIRHALSERVILRLAVHEHVFSRQVQGIEEQERADVARITGENPPSFAFPRFSSHHTSIRIGVDYVVSFARTGWTLAALPERVPELPPGPSPEARAAADLALQGDTAGAVTALRARLLEADDDVSAWRELALLLARMAEDRPAQREDAWQALRRAMPAYPGDEALLASFGRIRALMGRGGQEVLPPADLELSAIVADADAAGRLSLALGVRSGELPPAALDVRMEVSGPDGRPVELRRVGDAGEAGTVLELRGMPAADGVLRIEAVLGRVPAGRYGVRVRVSDPASGRSADAVGGFEIR